MRFLNYDLREPKGFIAPKGPNFNFARNVRIDFEGTELRFRAPRHSPDSKRLTPVDPERHYTLDDIYWHSFTREHDTRETPNRIEALQLFERYWSFYGPWLTGPQASLKMVLYLILPRDFDRPFSLYHPRVFEHFVGEYLTSLFGRHRNPDGSQDFKAPVNWQPLSHWPVPAARLEVLPTNRFSTWHDLFLFFTLSDQVLAYARFTPGRYSSEVKAEVDKRISAAPMLELTDQIIDSFSLTLSDEEKQKQQAALAGLEDTSLVREYPPLDWSVDPKAEVGTAHAEMAGR